MGVVHVDDIEAVERGEGRIASRFRRLGTATGGHRLQATLYEVEPGKAAFPFHAHFGMEESLYLLEGQGELRLGDACHAVGPGHYATFPVGPDHAHQLINTGTTTLKYLCMSAGGDPEVVMYPDSGKVGVMAGFLDGWPPTLVGFYRRGSEVGYFDGEDTGSD